MTIIRLAFSPDSDDIFMFWALLHGKVDAGDLDFEVVRHDTETLNALADGDSVDVLAMSIARWAEVSERWLLLPHGASVGRGYGPVVVAKEAVTLESLRGKPIGVPGLRTTAYAVLRVLLGEFEPVVIPIAPYSKSFDAIREGRVAAALLIHEGRLTYEREGFALVSDIGAEWTRLTGLPLALGGNAIRRALGGATIAKVSQACRASIAWGLEHREELMTALLGEESRKDVGLDRALLDRYLAMYANEDTREMKDDVKRGIEELFRRAHAVGLHREMLTPEFAP